ncbi:TPA: hypothetical protein ACH3X3_006595 [Trebouxia sp. C0006]
MLRVGQELASRGHPFTFLVSDQENMGLKHLGAKAFPGLEVVEFAGPPDIGTQDWFTQFSRDVMAILRSFQADMIAAAHHLYNDKATLHKLKVADYDALLKDGVYWPASVLSEVLNLTVVDVLSMGPAQPLLGQPWSTPNPVAYLPQLGSGLTPNMGFLQRCQNYLSKAVVEQVIMRLARNNQQQFMQESGLRVRAYEQGFSTSAAAIIAADWALEYPHPIPPKVHMVGPILAETAKHLPADLKAFVQQGASEGHAAVYVSMGTAARLTTQELHSLKTSLASLPNPVLWKLAAVDLPGSMSQDSLAATNIKIINWAPQNDVLGDPAVKVFVTHAGSNSIYEAAFHGKPVVCIPLLADQFDQAAKARYHGFGLTVTPAELTNSKPLVNAIQQILDKPHFTAAAQKVQKRLLNKPRHPAQLAADIVERVVATGSEPYLDTKAQTLSWWQLSLLDVKLFLAVVATALLCGLGGLLWVTARVLRHVGRRMLGRTWRKRAVQRKKVR